MKATLRAPRRFLALASAFFIPASASLIPLDALTLSAVFGGSVALSLLALACADYAHKPRFRVPPSRKPTRQSVPVQPAGSIDTSAAWTYQTVSA